MHLLRRSKALYCCLALSLAGCAQHHVELIESDLSAYYSRFLTEAALENVQLNIDSIIITEGEPAKPNELGHCTIGGGLPIVSVTKTYWDTATDASKEQLLFHELGHCLLDRQHLDGDTPNGIPISIMNTYHFDDFIYLQNREYYLRELFLGPFLENLPSEPGSNEY